MPWCGCRLAPLTLHTFSRENKTHIYRLSSGYFRCCFLRERRVHVPLMWAAAHYGRRSCVECPSMEEKSCVPLLSNWRKILYFLCCPNIEGNNLHGFGAQSMLLAFGN